MLGGAAVTAISLLVGLLTRGAEWHVSSGLLFALGALLLWYFLGLIGRLILVRSSDSRLPTPPLFLRWLGARFAIYFALPILLFCWLASLPLGDPWSGIAARALFSLLALNFLIGLVGYSVINSVLLLQRLRRQR